MPFVKGKSGNPSGRLRRGLSITDHIKELLNNDYAEFKLLHKYLEDKGEEHLGRITVARLVACRILMQAISGQAELTKELLNRVDGKVADRLEIESRKVELHFNITPAMPATAAAFPMAQRVLPDGAVSLDSEGPEI